MAMGPLEADIIIFTQVDHKWHEANPKPKHIIYVPDATDGVGSVDYLSWHPTHLSGLLVAYDPRYYHNLSIVDATVATIAILKTWNFSYDGSSYHTENKY